MLAIVDHRAPLEVKQNLKKLVTELLEFSSTNITYNSVSGHPDIFIFQNKEQIIIAPNSPKELMEFLNKHQVKYTLGNNPVGVSLKDSTWYNAVCSDQEFFAKKGASDPKVIDSIRELKFVELPQAYTCCSMLPINNAVITSDAGIAKKLKQHKIDHFLFNPKQISIVDHPYGFLGGTCGLFQNTLYFMGDVLLHEDGAELVAFVKSQGFEVVCLGRDYLYDGGGIFFVSQ